MKSALSTAIRLAILGSAIAATGAHAEDVSGAIIIPTLGYHYHTYDGDLNLDDGMFGSLGIGYRFENPWSVELTYKKLSTDTSIGNSSVDLNELRFDTLYNFAGGDKYQPFVLLGVGNQDWKYQNFSMDNTLVNLGMGVEYFVGEATSLYGDVRAIENLDDDSLTSVALSIGVKFYENGAAPAPKPVAAPVDSDKDGVIDIQDRCPGTKLGAKVDVYGCELVGDDDKDGVVNGVDQCPDTSAGAKVDAVGCYIKITETKEIGLNIEFETASFVIKAGANPDVAAVAQFMKEYPLTNVNIEGHTDNAGSDAYNMTLSQNRANAVAKMLTEEYGVAANRVSATGFGESKPLVANDTAANRAKNRRVTAKITATVERVQK
jgi:OmpA-OmpF porin, OOP family